MPTNTQVVAALQPGTVPADQECIPGNMTELLQRIAAYMGIASTVQQISGGTTDSVAAQALQQANIAIATAQDAQDRIPERRSSRTLAPLNTGDNVVPITWQPDMPSTNYEVRVTLYGPNAAAAQFYGFRVIDGSRTVGGCQVIFDNMPATTQFAWVVEDLA